MGFEPTISWSQNNHSNTKQSLVVMTTRSLPWWPVSALLIIWTLLFYHVTMDQVGSGLGWLVAMDQVGSELGWLVTMDQVGSELDWLVTMTTTCWMAYMKRWTGQERYTATVRYIDQMRSMRLYHHVKCSDYIDYFMGPGILSPVRILTPDWRRAHIKNKCKSGETVV